LLVAWDLERSIDLTIMPLGSSTDDSCPNMSDFSYALGVILIVGTWLSYFPQQLKLWQRRTHVGLDFQNFAFGQLVTLYLIASYLLLSYRSTFDCCGAGVSLFDCTSAYLALSQLAVSTVCQHICLAFYMIFFDHDFENEQEQEKDLPVGTIWRRTYRAYILLLLVELVIIGLIPILMNAFGIDSNEVNDYGVAITLTSSVTIAYHWMPQIYATYKLRRLGSLSLVMLFIQSTGSLLVAFSESSHGGPELWLPFVVVAIMQYILIGEVFYFYLKDRKPDVPLTPRLILDDSQERGRKMKLLVNDEDEELYHQTNGTGDLNDNGVQRFLGHVSDSTGEYEDDAVSVSEQGSITVEGREGLGNQDLRRNSKSVSSLGDIQ